MSEDKRYIWYDPQANKLIETSFDLGIAIYESAKGNPIPGVKTFEVTQDYKSGRMIGIDDSICEFIGEL